MVVFQSGPYKELHEQSDEELDRNLRVFYAEVRNKYGENYTESQLYSASEVALSGI